MHKLWLLIKVNFINNLNINKFNSKYKGSSAKKIGLVLALLGGLAIIGYVFFYMFVMAMAFKAAGATEGILYFGFVIGTIMIVITTINRAYAYLFVSKDYNMLMSYPIDSRVIISSKIIGLLLLNYLGFIAFFLPAIFWYAVFASPRWYFYIYALFTLVLAPLVIVAVFSFISYLITIIFSRFKYKKMLQMFFMLLFIFGIIYLQNRYLMDSEVSDDAYIAMQAVFRKIYYPSKWVVSAMIENNIIDFLKFVGISIIPFLVFIHIVGKNYVKAHARANVGYVNKRFKLKEYQQTNKVKSLIKLEIKKYFAIPMVVLNTIMGPIMGLFFIAIIVFGTQGEEVFFQEMNLMVSSLCFLVLVFANGLVSTTSASISLEGKSFWLLKSLPIEEKNIFKAKVMVNLLISFPFTVISCVLMGIFLHINILILFLILILVSLVNLVMGNVGLIFNITFPKLDWTNPVKVVKQSLSTFLTMLFGFFAILGPLIALENIFIDNIYLLLFTSGIFILLLFLLSNYLLNRYFISKFRALNN